VHFRVARSVHLSVPWRSCLGYRHAGCLQLSHGRPQEMCGLRTRSRTDVDPPRFLDRTAIGGRGISSRRPRGDIAKFHYTTPTAPDPTGQSADFVWSGRVRSGPSSGIQRIPCWWLITLSSPSSCFPFPTFPPTLLPLPNFTLISMSR